MSTGKTLKYVRHSVAGFVVWPKQLEGLAHKDIGRAMGFCRDVAHGEILSAGFIDFNAGNQPVCHGRSESLNINSMAADTAAFRAQWGFPTDPEPVLTSEMKADAAKFAACAGLDGLSLEPGADV